MLFVYAHGNVQGAYMCANALINAYLVSEVSVSSPTLK